MKEPEELSEMNQLFRDFGKKFSVLRDSHVRQILLFDLKILSEFRQYHPVLNQLEELNQAAVKKTEQSMLVGRSEFSAFKDLLTNDPQIGHYFELNKPDPLSVLDTFSIGYLKSYNAFNNAVQNLDPNLMHEWRKRLKDVQYQLELIYGNLNHEIHEHHIKIRELCEFLGQLNDLDMMNNWIQSNRMNLSSDININSKFFDELNNKQEKFLDYTLTVGEELYRVTPEVFKDKLV